MFSPVNKNLATSLFMTSCVLVDLYRRFGVTYVSLVWRNFGNHPRLFLRWWKFNLRNVVNHIFNRVHQRCILCPSVLLRCVLSNLWLAGVIWRIASEQQSCSCARNEDASWSGGMPHLFLTSTLDGGKRSTSWPGRIISRKNAFWSHWEGSRMGSRGGLDTL
jgi:hypothetical protein